MSHSAQTVVVLGDIYSFTWGPEDTLKKKHRLHQQL